MISRLLFPCLATVLLSACQTLPPLSASPDDVRLRELVVQNRALSARLAALEARQSDLERSIAVLAGSSAHASATTAPDTYRQARQAFNAGQYARTVTLLHAYSSGTGNDNTTADALWLLARSHEKLLHCESAIQTAKLFARRFPAHAAAPDAWLLLARCQIRIQQKDSARETLRYLISTYPRSRAAKSAHTLLK